MTTLAADQPRDYYQGDFHECPMVASDIIYQGAAVGADGSGNARPLVAADQFLGFAELKADNSTGAAGAKNVRLRKHGYIKLPIAALAKTNVGDSVYASDDNTFTLTAAGNSLVGTVDSWIETGYGIIKF